MDIKTLIIIAVIVILLFFIAPYFKARTEAIGPRIDPNNGITSYDEVQQKFKTIGLIEAIIQEDWEYRYFSYNSNWSENEELASYRDGGGGEYFVLLSSGNIAYKCTSPDDGFADNPKKMLKQLPDKFNSFVHEPAFNMEYVSCIGYLNKSKWEQFGIDVKWSMNPLQVLNWKDEYFQKWASEYYEKDFDLEVIKQLYQGEFSIELAKKLNPEVDIDKLLREIKEIGIKL